jgi:hypothetical protein
MEIKRIALGIWKQLASVARHPIETIMGKNADVQKTVAMKRPSNAPPATTPPRPHIEQVSIPPKATPEREKVALPPTPTEAAPPLVSAEELRETIVMVRPPKK